MENQNIINEEKGNDVNHVLAGRTSERLSAWKMLEKVDKMPTKDDDPENCIDRLDKTLLAMKMYADQEVNATLETIYKRINARGRVPKRDILMFLQLYAR